jgi:protein TonB
MVMSVPRRSLLQRIAQGRGASPVAFVIALLVHVGLIVVGLVFYKSAMRYEAPELVLPKGFATEVDGSGEAGARLSFQEAPLPAVAVVADADAADAQRRSLEVPADFEPPDVIVPVGAIDPGAGTSDDGLAPAFATGQSPPAVNFHAPPIPIESASPSIAKDNSHASGDSSPPQTAGAANHDTATATGNGGGSEGVPEGMPLPSPRNKRPDYPEDVRRRGWTGTVRLELDLDERGHVTAARVVQSSGYDVLDRSALKAARTWIYSPAVLNGRAVAVTLPVTVNYGLR